MNFSAMLHNLTDVLLAGLVLGAGLPALFALGIRFVSGVGHAQPDGTFVRDREANPFEKALGYACFAIIVAAIVIGILWITKAVIYDYFSLDIFGTEANGSSSGH